uniref:Proton-coupled folate transporter-like n=1 Tax=Crassostrea virginica TaxID=6565 RepID=A0A8B8E2I1_CRAVI|nr:proton-coupled folate transporter-like [Crassostrea virginica]
MQNNSETSTQQEKENSKETNVPSKLTSKRKYLVGPIAFLHLLGYAIYSSTIFLYYPYNIGKTLFVNLTVENEKSAVCGSNTNTTGEENGKQIQTEVATFLTYIALVEGIPCIFSNLLFGSLGDRFGRRKLLLIPVLGVMLAEGLIIAFMYFGVTLYYFLIPLMIHGFSGEAFAMIQFTLAYASNITKTNKQRTIGMAIMEICIGMGLLLGSVVAGYIIREETIAIVGAISGTISLVAEGLTNSTVLLFLTPVIGFGISLGIVMTRVIMSREISPEQQGALFGGMSAFQTACTFFGSLMFSAIYRGTIYVFKGTIFLLMAGMFFISLILTITILLEKKSKEKTYNLQGKTISIKLK